jgi:hypothetical protein
MITDDHRHRCDDPLNPRREKRDGIVREIVKPAGRRELAGGT